MPVEGQSRKPLTRRDRRLIVALGCAAVIGVVALTVFLATRSSHSKAACVVVRFPSTVGGATLRRCGPAAHTLCRTEGRRDATVAAACRRDGYAADVARR